VQWLNFGVRPLWLLSADGKIDMDALLQLLFTRQTEKGLFFLFVCNRSGKRAGGWKSYEVQTRIREVLDLLSQGVSSSSLFQTELSAEKDFVLFIQAVSTHHFSIYTASMK